MLNSGAQMKELRCLVVLAVALVFGLSFALPAEDIPETPYDESETLPYECTPVFAFAAVLRSPSPAVMSHAFVSTTFVVPTSRAVPGREVLSSDAVTSLTILDHAFRC